MTDLRKNTTFMHFWDAINEGRAERGMPEALYANVRDMWQQAMQPTQVERANDVRRNRRYAAELTLFQNRHPEWSAEEAKENYDRLFAL